MKYLEGRRGGEDDERTGLVKWSQIVRPTFWRVIILCESVDRGQWKTLGGSLEWDRERESELRSSR